MNILMSLRSELLKNKGTASFYLCVLTAACIPLLLLLEQYSGENATKELIADPWAHHFDEGSKGLNLMFLPMYIVLICTLLPQVEYRNNTWKQVLTSPQSLGNIVIAKFLTVQVFILLFLIAYMLFMVSMAVAYNFINPALNFLENSIEWSQLLLLTFKTYLSVLAISAVQFWIGLRSKSFIVPVAIGLCLVLAAGLLIFKFRWEHAEIYPFTYPILVLLKSYKSDVPMLLLSSAGCAMIFLGLAFMDLRARNIRG
ncbi:ABC transporter permease [Cesiribacter sp. SM1]|uniref:ABC transporter permease n=1 Tax=Cesiribacter sp. SM1 TaxID=2861196 RepID=UPI001CD1F7F7|nr:ABC transporter permease [Cesiribacter sp. SM1]